MFELSRSPVRLENGYGWMSVRFVVCPAALIQGNHRNCTQFASSKHIDWLVRRLEGQESSKGRPIDSHLSPCISDVCTRSSTPVFFHIVTGDPVEQPMRTRLSLVTLHTCWLRYYTCMLPWLPGSMFFESAALMCVLVCLLLFLVACCAPYTPVCLFFSASW